MADTPGGKERYEVLYEEIGTKVQLVLEGHAVLDQKIDRLDDKIDHGVQEISRKLDFGFVKVLKEIRELQGRFDIHERVHAS